MRDPRIAGVGLTTFGNTPERTGRDLFAEASSNALADTGVPREDVEALFYGNFMGALAEHQAHQGPLMADAAGVSCEATRFEMACASSGAAVRQAVLDVRTGEKDVVLVGGMERMNNMGTAGATDGLAIAADDLHEVHAGVTFPGAYALMERAYFEHFGGGREDLAHVAVKNHQNALENEKAQYRQEIAVEDVVGAPTVSDPIGLYDACPITDGAAALILVSDAYAAEHDVDAPIAIRGSGQGGDRLALQDRTSCVRTPAAVDAAEEAYDDAGIGPDDVDVAEVHDCFTIAEVLAIESLGFYEHGDGITAASEGETTADGDRPVNLSGGLKAKGHPVGATGASQIAELTSLLRGDHVNSDVVSDANLGVAHNAGGTVASCVVHVLEVVA